MNNFTLKLTAVFLLASFFQSQAQVVEGTAYTLKNYKTNEYLYSDGARYYFKQTAGDPVEYNFKFYHQDTVNNNETPDDTSDDVAHNYTDDWNIQNDLNGIMRDGGMKTNNVTTHFEAMHTTFKYNVWNKNGGWKTDKRWAIETVDVSGVTYYRIKSLSGNRYLNSEATDVEASPENESGLLQPKKEEDLTDVTSSYWILEVSTLSNDKLDDSSVFMSNPVKDNVSITGLTSEINQIHVYSLLGAKVLSQEVNNAASLQMNVSGLSKGMYIVDFVGENGNFTKKLIKE